MAAPHDFDAVVFSGGGATAGVFIGAARYLEHVGVLPGAVRTFAGTSAGAMMALFCALGWNAKRVQAWVLRYLPDLSEVDVEGILELPTRLGLDDGARLEAALRAALPASWGGAVTFVELAKRTGRHLVICAANVTLSRSEFLSIDTAPDLDVVKAVRMSASVPLVFSPVTHQGCLYVDGALYDNLPTGFASASALRSRRTLAINVDLPFFRRGAEQPSAGTDAEPPQPPGLVEFLYMLVRAAVVGANGGGAAAAAQDGSVVRVDIKPYESAGSTCGYFCAKTMRFNIDEADVRAMADHGYERTREALLPTSVGGTSGG